jgi:hypothetical protein
VERKAIDEKSYDLKAVNPHARNDEDLRTPEELMDLIEAKGKEVAEAIVTLRGHTTSRGEQENALPQSTTALAVASKGRSTEARMPAWA